MWGAGEVKTGLNVIETESLDKWKTDGPDCRADVTRKDQSDVVNGRSALRLPTGKLY